MVIKAEVRKLTTRTHSLLNTIQTQKQYLTQKVTGGINLQTGRLNKPLNTAGIHKYMLLGEGNISLEGYKLKKRLNTYVNYLNETFKPYGYLLYQGLRRATKIMHCTCLNLLKKEKDFPEAYFQDTTVIMALVYLSYFEATILSYQEEVIQYLLLNTIIMTKD